MLIILSLVIKYILTWIKDYTGVILILRDYIVAWDDLVNLSKSADGGDERAMESCKEGALSKQKLPTQPRN